MTTNNNHDEVLAGENWEGWSTRPNRWLHIPPQLTARLAEASVNVDNFELYIREVLSVFPLDWADDLVNIERSTTGDIAQEPLGQAMIPFTHSIRHLASCLELCSVETGCLI
jgi:hypothetical protein